MKSSLDGRLSPMFLEQIGLLSQKVALRKDGLCRGRPESPRPVEDDDRAWFKSAMECDIREIKYMLERNQFMADKKDTVMFTALHWAAKKGNVEMTELLASTGMNVNIKTRGGYTALHFAAIHDHEEIISILVDEYGANINIRDNSGKKPKHFLKEGTSPWIQRKLGKYLKSTVSSISKDGALVRSLGTIGTLIVPVSPLSTSLESGLNKIGIDDNNEEPQESIRTSRRGSFVKFYQNLKIKSKRAGNSNLEVPSDEELMYRLTQGRAKSAPDIKNIFDYRRPMRSALLTP